MPFKCSLAAMLAICVPFCAFRAWAGASLYIDDAAITPSGHCQVESWVRLHAPGHELSAVPACNVAGTELALGASRSTHPNAGPLWSLGAKHLFRDFDTHAWGAGVSLGANWDAGVDRWTGWSANVPFSVALDARRSAVLHANLGWSKAEGAPGTVTGGVGLELELADAWTLLADAYGDHRGAAVGQLGVRHALNELTTLDLLLGRQTGPESGPWLTLGLNVLLPH